MIRMTTVAAYVHDISRARVSSRIDLRMMGVRAATVAATAVSPVVHGVVRAIIAAAALAAAAAGAPSSERCVSENSSTRYASTLERGAHTMAATATATAAKKDVTSRTSRRTFWW